MKLDLALGGAVRIDAHDSFHGSFCVDLEVRGAHEYEHDSRGLMEPDIAVVQLSPDEARQLADAIRAALEER